MIRAILAAACLLLAACGGFDLPSPAAAPAPLAATTIDEKALGATLLAYEGVLQLVDQRLSAGDLRGAKAAAVSRQLEVAWSAIAAARAARAAGSATDYLTALRQAQLAVTAAQSALKGK
ncbi:MAG: hypothetical protein INF91_10670 [Alphaproteobacteria bacterium]|nr:hypothetical protein [Alphaproteobacteria bacterium]